MKAAYCNLMVFFCLECGIRSATSQTWPWTAYVYQLDSNKTVENQKVGNSCGGVLISPSHILTAAHCVEMSRNNPSNVIVHFNNFETWLMKMIPILKETSRSVKKLHFSPLLELDARNNHWGQQADLVVIELSRPFFWTQPVCLPYIAEEHIKVNSNLTFTGYGGGKIASSSKVHHNVVIPTSTFILGFHESQIEVFDGKKCHYSANTLRIYEFMKLKLSSYCNCCLNTEIMTFDDLYDHFVLSENQSIYEDSFPWRLHPFLCSKKSTTKGDSGGPLMMQTSRTSWTLIAISIRLSTKPSSRIQNFCNGDVEEFYYSEYQLVAPFLPWIRKILEDANWQ